MNKILVVSAFPKKEKSLGESLLGGIKDELELINLYDFNLPFFKEEKEFSKEAQKIFSKLDEYDNWLFLFPVWWSNMPGIMKNFFDTALHYGLLYNGKSVPAPALNGKGKKAVIICTSGDVYEEDQNEVTRLIAEEILPYWGVEVLGSLFIEDTYNFNEKKFKKSQEAISEIINKF